MMYLGVILDMKNVNALISMAQVSENANNPFSVFCEHIKYVLTIKKDEFIDFNELKKSILTESGIVMPNNVIVQCLNYLQREGYLTQYNHQIQVVGSFDTTLYDQTRLAYRKQEETVINALIQFAKSKGREWDYNHARDQLIIVLDNDGLAHDIFYNEENNTILSDDDSEIATIDQEESDDNETPIYSDRNIVGRFIYSLKNSNTIEWEYLRRIVEGLMICIGTYQLPDISAPYNTPQIANTPFLFDTRLLLRFVGCADQATCDATRELVAMIQKANGRIYYYPHTFEEIECAFDEAIRSIENKGLPYDHEMRIYCSSINNNAAVLRAKKANIRAEFASSKIWERPINDHDEQDRIAFSFPQSVFTDYMKANLRWELKTIKNDALSIWETHMCRRGNYNEYCGTNNHLCVFVTSNSKLVSTTLAFHRDHPEIQSINGWRSNRLPVITDTRLTCRLWAPALQGERLSILRMTANVVAALKPTPQYISRIRKVSIEIGKQVPEFATIQLSEYFDNQIADAIFNNTKGPADEINIGQLATTMSELVDYRMYETAEENKELSAKLETQEMAFDDQTQNIIDGAVQANIQDIGLINNAILHLSLHWESVIFVLFAAIAALCSGTIINKNTAFIAGILGLIKAIELLSASHFIQRIILSFALPKVKDRITERISKNARQAEVKYQDIIIQRVLEEQTLIRKCEDIINKKNVNHN